MTIIRAAGRDRCRRYGTEAFVCLQLRRAARCSVETGAVLAFC
ncbi:hypothetical protein [Kitasatospora phosalacinea]|uniref:Uncharacterized protein n=1 Tax=Kitasatospora phosalacinea TaxID=2065 RepID=A0ABW6GR93_9ACTN